MIKWFCLLIVVVSVLRSSAQDCIDYVLHFQSNVLAGGTTGAYYNISAANLSVGNGFVSFDENTTEHWDTLCMTAGCNLSMIIDPSTMPAAGSFDVQVWALGAPLQFSSYDWTNGVIQATFCCTAPCPNQIQTQFLECNTYDFYVGAFSGNVLWNFGDTSNDPMGNYQQHTFLQNGMYNVLAMVDIAGCGPEYILNAPVSVNCDTTLSCPTDLILEALTCQDYFLHFDVPVYGTVDWQVDGVSLNTNSSEAYVFLEYGLHEVIAIYHPVGTEVCMDNWPLTFWDTVTVACEVCQPVFMGFSSVLELGGTEMLMYAITNENGVVVNQGAVDFTANQPVFDFYDCWADGCYYLDICSEGPVADSNFIVDAIAPLVIISDEQYTTGLCNGRLLQLGLNNDCAPPTCDGEWLTLSVDAAYLTVPPFFSPDSLYWNVLDVNGIELGQGYVGINDAAPNVSDSVCMALPLTCYQVSAWVTDQIWGMTYANVSATLMDTTIYGMINPNSNTWVDNLVIVSSMNCFAGVESGNDEPMMLMPNPCEASLNVPSGVDEVEIFAMTGNLIFKQSIMGATTLDVRALPNGIWVVKSYGKNGQFWTQRIVKI
jgi:hypothetical protein